MMMKLATALLLCFWFTGAVAAETSLPSPTTTLEIGSPHIQYDQHSWYDFGMVRTGFVSFARFNLTNTGAETLWIRDIGIEGMDYSAFHNCPETLAPQEVCTIEVHLQPMFDGLRDGRLYITTSGGQIVVDLHAWARRF